MTFEIGYRRPPKSTQFKKGTSGNPKGRPRGSRNFLTLLDKELNQAIVVTENGKKKKLSRMEAMVKKLVSGALQGDTKAALTMIEILRRTGHFELSQAPSLLPDNHELILSSFLERQLRKSQNNPIS